MIKILAVDDSPTMHRLFKMIFSTDEYELKLADNGEEGLRLVKEFSPDLILLDFIMPKMNGFQFCKVLREDYGLKELPVLLITSKAEDVGDKFIEKFKCIDYIAKPFQPDELVEKVNQVLNKCDNGPGGESEIDVLLDIEDKKGLASYGDEENSQKNEKSETYTSVSVVEEIIAKVEKDVLPTLRKSIEKYLKFETGYMISDIKGESITIDKITDIMSKFDGELTVFNNECDYHFLISGGYITYCYKGDNRIEDLFELLQDITGTCLLEVDDFVSLYSQIRSLGFEDSLLKRCFIFYVANMLVEAIELKDNRYYVDLVEVSEAFKSKNWISFEDLNKIISDFKEERIEINKVVFDEGLVPIKNGSSADGLKSFESRVFELCDGKRCVGEILRFFGSNRQYVKNTIGTLILTGYLKI
jgi:DNA-binding response OmpR family regulator